MLRLLKTELWKLKRYSVIWIGVAAMFSVVLLTRFMAIAYSGAAHTLENFSNDVIWNNFTLIYPATITLITGYIMERERTDDTMKNLLVLPVSFRRLLTGKLLASGLLAIFLAVIEFIFAITVFFISGFTGFSLGIAFRSLFQMIGMNLCVYIAVLPIIVFTGQRSGTYMAGVAFAFFYGFVGVFASGHGLTNFYPVSVGLGLICYQGDGTKGTFDKSICFVVLLLMLALSVVMITFSYDRAKKQTNILDTKRK